MKIDLRSSAESYLKKASNRNEDWLREILHSILKVLNESFAQEQTRGLLLLQ